VLNKLWLPALFALTISMPAVAHAQMGGGMGGADDEKKDEPKKDEPKKDEGEKKPDAPKADEPKKDSPKTLAFEAPASFKEDKGGRGMQKHLYRLEAVEGEQEAVVAVIYAGTGADYGKEKARWVGQFKDKDGKALPASAVKEDTFETNGLKGKIAEVAGMFAPRQRGKGKGGAEGGDQKAPEAKWTKVINVYIEGPDGGWILRLQGGEKTVDKYKDDFMKYAKSAKIVDGKQDEPKRGGGGGKKPNE